MSEVFGKLLEVEPRAWITLIVIVALSTIGFISLSRTKDNTSSTLRTKKVVYGGICMSISFVLSYIRIFHLPQGGSITLASMFPLVLYSMLFGPMAGIVAGIAYGFLQLIQDMWVINIAQLLLDYPLAFGCIGLAGLAPKAIKNVYLRTSLALIIAFFGRGFMHVVSGALFFGEYAPEGVRPLIYSLSYNGVMIFGELIITLILALILVGTPVYNNFKKLAIPSF
ncbi:MAG: energy-coupled thiamine transporter ThiT [Cellulosilyticum sp.]|nr:energy-coupled thiamine transporter ThiT [Cellulosilyticum sp.]